MEKQPDIASTEAAGNGQEAVPEVSPVMPASEAPASEVPAPEAPHQAQTLPEAREITKARALDLRTLLGTYIRRHLPPSGPPPERAPEPPRMEGAYAHLLPWLRLIPWTLGLLFAFSFVWDFDGIVFSPFGYALPLDGLLRIIAVSGLIGFYTNWLAITMLFQPRDRRVIFGQGLIPAQRERVIYRLAKAVAEELINETIIKQKIEESRVIPKYRAMAMTVTRGVLEDPEFRQDVKKLTSLYVEEVLASEEVQKKLGDFIEDKLEEHAGEGLSGLALRAYRFLNEEDFQRRIDKAVEELPASLDRALDQMDHLLDRLPETIETHSHEIEEAATKMVLGFVENLDIYSMIVENMRRYDEQQLENLIKSSSNEQLNYIKYLGGVLGCIGGLVIWRPLLSLTVLGLLVLALYAIDEALFRARRKI